MNDSRTKAKLPQQKKKINEKMFTSRQKKKQRKTVQCSLLSYSVYSLDMKKKNS